MHSRAGTVPEELAARSLSLCAHMHIRMSLPCITGVLLFTLGSRAVQRRKSGDRPNLSGALSGGRNLPAPHAPWRGAKFRFPVLAGFLPHTHAKSERSARRLSATSLAAHSLYPSYLPTSDAFFNCSSTVFGPVDMAADGHRVHSIAFTDRFPLQCCTPSLAHATWSSLEPHFHSET